MTMTVRKYVEIISELAKKHPKLKVAYAIDEEGNAYHYVHYAPSKMKVPVFGENEKETEVICIN